MNETADNTELALERTQFAEDRTIMAMERTFAGWMRTAFASIGIGLAFHVLFDTFDPPGLAKAIASAFIIAGGALAISAQRRACRTLAKLNAHQIATPSAPNFRLLAYLVATGAVVLVVGLWLLHEGPAA